MHTRKRPECLGFNESCHSKWQAKRMGSAVRRPEEDHEHPVCCPVVGSHQSGALLSQSPGALWEARNSATMDGGGMAVPWLLLPTSVPWTMQTLMAAHPKNILLKQLERKEAPSMGEEHQS